RGAAGIGLHQHDSCGDRVRTRLDAGACHGDRPRFVVWTKTWIVTLCPDGLAMLGIDGLRLASPRLPPRRLIASTLAFVSVLVHVSFAAALVLLLRAMPPVSVNADATRKAEQVVPPRMVFLASPKPGGGGGGGGNRQAGPIRHAVAIGRDRMTLPARRVVSPIAPATHVSDLDVRQGSLMLDAKPLASGTFE